MNFRIRAETDVGGVFLEDLIWVRLYEVLRLVQSRIQTKTTWFGVKAQKQPMDFWVYQEIIWKVKPDYIVEIGNHMGGSTLALAHLCDLMEKGTVIGVDIDHSFIAPSVRKHPRIILIEGDAVEVFPRVKEIVGNSECIVIDDSSHTYENTLRILRTYSSLIRPGGYLIVEDSIVWHGLSTGPFPGPYEAIEVFLMENPEFYADREVEFPITWNPKGFLRRK